MPLYDYRCSKGHKSEVKAGYDVKILPCLTCGRDAVRQAIYRSQYINGETVAKSSPKASRMGNVVDKHGRYRTDLFQEAAQEAGDIGPAWEEAKRRARRINGGKVMYEPSEVTQAT